ncbi:Thioredoxin [anaerobic digester metagenome]
MDEELARIREQRLQERVAAQKKTHLTGVLTATRENFSALVATWPYLVIDCWAPWCGPCRRVSPVVEALAGEFSGRIAFAKLNTDEHPQVAVRYGISAIPTLLLFRSGALVGQITGAYPIDPIRQEILRSFQVQ